jgi:hypothetical protein
MVRLIRASSFSSSSRPPTSSSSCNHSHNHKRLRRQRKATACASRRGSHADSQARRGQTKGNHSLAHLWLRVGHFLEHAKGAPRHRGGIGTATARVQFDSIPTQERGQMRAAEVRRRGTPDAGMNAARCRSERTAYAFIPALDANKATTWENGSSLGRGRMGCRVPVHGWWLRFGVLAVPYPCTEPAGFGPQDQDSLSSSGLLSDRVQNGLKRSKPTWIVRISMYPNLNT